MRQSLLAALLAMSAAAAFAGPAASPISGQHRSGDLPNFDANEVARAAATAVNGSAARSALQGAVSRFGYRSQFDERLGTTFLWAGKADREAVSVSSALSGKAQHEARARQFLVRHAKALGLSRGAIDEAKLFDAHDIGEGPVITRFRQQRGGVEVFGRELNVISDRSGRLVAIGGYFAPQADGSSLRAAASYRLAAPKAIAAAFADLGGEAGQVFTAGSVNGAYQSFQRGEGRGDLQLESDPRVKKVWFNLGAELVPAWYVELSAATRDGGRQADYGYVISGVDGSVLFRKNQTAHAAFSYRTFADANAVGQPFDEPLGNSFAPFPKADPNATITRKVVAPKLVTLSASSLLSTGDPWLVDGSTVTTGNNVDAYLDLAKPNGFTAGKDVRPSTTSANTFDYAVKGDSNPKAAVQRNGAVVNLFYMNNYLHDFWYDRGFNEAAGNAQKNNFGRGGVGNDPIKAEGQDYSGRSNANMATPADGGSPRMQMYLFDGLLKG